MTAGQLDLFPAPDPDIGATGDRAYLAVCGICHAAEGVRCAETLIHVGRRWELPFGARGGARVLIPSGGGCEVVTEHNYVWDHTVDDGGESDRVAMLYRGACFGCGWHGDPHEWDKNAAVEDAHDHSWPGWRTLPVVPRCPDDVKKRAKWLEMVRRLYTDAGVDMVRFMPGSGAPILTERQAVGKRSHWSHEVGGYDICARVLP